MALRAPYMHNASLATLDEVVRHYEKGGIDRPSRSPLLILIQLSDAERSDLVVFMAPRPMSLRLATSQLQ